MIWKSVLFEQMTLIKNTKILVRKMVTKSTTLSNKKYQNEIWESYYACKCCISHIHLVILRKRNKNHQQYSAKNIKQNCIFLSHFWIFRYWSICKWRKSRMLVGLDLWDWDRKNTQNSSQSYTFGNTSARSDLKLKYKIDQSFLNACLRIILIFDLFLSLTSVWVP